MRSGALRHRVTFKRATDTDDALGAPIPSLADLATVWANVKPLAGIERYSAMQTQAGVDHMIECRYVSDISDLAPDDVATWGSITFDIKSVINVRGRNSQLQVFVKQHI